MTPTDYPHVNTLLGRLMTAMQALLGRQLVGLYLYGSLVTGDFDEAVSDVDLLAVLSDDLDDTRFEMLDRMHSGLVASDPAWYDRIEIAYLSLNALKTFRAHPSRIAVISPGELFHFKDAGKEWLVNWYIVREKGVTLSGPPPGAIIDPITQDEFIQVVKEHVAGWRTWINDMHDLPAQAYAILTLCRGLYTCTHGEQVSKLQAALWVEQRLPEWSPLIQKALRWRRGWRAEDESADATFPETRRFVLSVIDQILR